MARWNETAAAFVTGTTCPRCEEGVIREGVCAVCGADLSGPIGAELWDASLRAAEALRARQAIIDRIPLPASRSRATTVSEPSPGTIPGPATASPAAARERASSHVSVQSVLAVAGAGLFAVAAIVFTFFNPDLTDLATRSTIIAVITAIFVAGSLLFARRGLQFSAEAIGALAAVFLGLDVWAVSRWGDALGEWTAGALGLLAAAGVLLLLAVRARVRIWLWAALAALPFVPVLLAAQHPDRWMPVLGALGAGVVVLGTLELLPRLRDRFASALRTEQATAAVLLAGVMIATVVLVITADGFTGAARALAAAGSLLALALIARLAARRSLRTVWSFLAGALTTVAGTVAALAVEPADPAWILALVCLGASIAVALIAVLPVLPGAHAAALRAGSWSVATAVAVPAVGVAAAQAVLHVLRLLTGEDVVPSFPAVAIAAVTGLGATAIGLGLSRLRPRAARGADGSPDRSPGGVPWPAPPLLVLALLTLAGWAALRAPTQVVLGVLLAVALVVVGAAVPAVRDATGSVRTPLTIGAHALVIQSGVIAWTHDDTRVLGGVIVLAGVVALGARRPRARAVYVTVGYAWALAVLAAALDSTVLTDIAVLSITTAAAALAAVVATLTRWLDVRSWYGVLIVTTVPFLVAIIGVILERSGWTALSTSVFVVLLMTLVLTSRPGLTAVLRAFAAALVLPAIAVVVISLGAQVLAVSASPITLPVIAVLVAVALPATEWMRTALQRRGLEAPTARLVRIAVEVSALVTGAIAVVLALLRSAAGIPTTFLVLVIIGLGALATGLFARRRYAWVVAGASFTGALWCVWWLAGVQVLEPYLLPPALGAAIVGMILTARASGPARSTVGLYAAGLAVAVVPVLVVLAVTGSDGAVLPWRTLGLLAGSVFLLVLGGSVARSARLAALRAPTHLLALIAALGGTVQAVRFSRDLDVVPVADPSHVMLVALALSATSAVLAALAARRRAVPGTRAARWNGVPALVALIIGPISAVREGWMPILVLLGLALALLALMIVTTARAVRGPVALPPVLVTFVLAWVTAVASWSERELRVEAFSLPLGLALLACGVIAWRRPSDAERPRGIGALVDWPVGFRGSWALLAPGILVTLGPSIMATGTDPRTERAILVIALALVSILVGALQRLAAPFILGIIALPVENVVVFVVQIGQQISALPWWITLATAGAVLLVIAISSERRSTGGGVAARLRDLR